MSEWVSKWKRVFWNRAQGKNSYCKILGYFIEHSFLVHLLFTLFLSTVFYIIFRVIKLIKNPYLVLVDVKSYKENPSSYLLKLNHHF